MTEVKEVPTAATTPLPVKPALPVKLTTEEQNKRYQFIGKCVDKGINFPFNARFGVQGALTVQDLCNSSVKTLADIAKKIKKEEAEHDPEFSGNEILKIASVPATDWLDFLRLTIRKKNWDAYASDRRAEKKSLQGQIAAAKTPDELRKEAELKLASLDSEFADED